MMDLIGRVAIITGAASGIGRAAAEKLAAAGAAVLATDIDAEGLKETEKRISEANGGTCRTALQDVGDEDRWTGIMTEAQALGVPSILVNNAGVAIFGMVADQSLEDWQRQMRINLDSVFLGTRAAIRAMRDTGGGAIVNISSVAGLLGSSGTGAYSASKGGVRLFTKAAAVECAQMGYDIRINSVHPGVIETPIWQKLVIGGGDTSEDASALKPTPRANAIDVGAISKQKSPMARPGTADEVGDLIVFLASPKASYITGQEFVIDGGMTAGF